MHDFQARHIGPSEAEQATMLRALGSTQLDAFIARVIPAGLRRKAPFELPAASEETALAELARLAANNQPLKSFIGQGYYGTHTPGVILRNILENPAWYTAYTPYQAEISQGRLEALLNFQTMVCDLTGMPIANASLLDEATAAAEAMTLARRSVQAKGKRFIVAGDAHPQTIEVIQTRAAPLGIEVVLANSAQEWDDLIAGDDYFAVLDQYPSTSGRLGTDTGDTVQVHARQAAYIVCADLLALCLLKPPGEWDGGASQNGGADIVVGSTQRFGMPMGNGGPHAAYLACRDEFKRSMPGRLVGVSVDAHDQPALRLALQTREQHIRREKATSNICTAQVLPGIVASMYAVYHGPKGLRHIAERVALLTARLAAGLQQLGYTLTHEHAFDTLTCHVGSVQAQALAKRAEAHGANIRVTWDEYVTLSLDETTTEEDLTLLWTIFAQDGQTVPDVKAIKAPASLIPAELHRSSAYLTHPVFNTHHSETAMLRYIRRLSDKDLALDRSMIPLGSCTMKLNATSEMIPITWPAFANIHPFAPARQRRGYDEMAAQLSQWLCQATGYDAVSLQPNAGSQGEYAGLLAIRAYQRAQGQGQRDVCLIPASAHGTNPASAHMVGMQVVVTACDAQGNVDLHDLRAKAEQHRDRLAACMVTYPSTHGVFEADIRQLCDIVHAHGGQVYVDGANLNALVGLVSLPELGADVSHLNLHKTFCIPHGGGGPGVGPVAVRAHLAPYLPGSTTVGPVSAAPLGNAGVLPISWMYIRMMGSAGLTRASQVAILNANYIAERLRAHYPVLYSGAHGTVAHECILDLRPLKEATGISNEDVAKRLIDYGFHAPTMSFPVPGTLMVEPTESEPFEELERFIAAMIAIRMEIEHVQKGHWPREDNPLRAAPFTAAAALKVDWPHPYSRAEAAMPMTAKGQSQWADTGSKYWPPVGRVDNVWGDRNLSCTCPPLSDYAQDTPA